MAHVSPLPGAKAILYHDGALVSLLRDDIPTIPFPNHWDLPGGGVEPGETAIEAVIREIKEETGLLYTTDAFTWRRVYTGRNGRLSHFFAAPISSEQIAAIVLGDEGQAWRMMDCREFAARPDTIPHFRARVSDFFAT